MPERNWTVEEYRPRTRGGPTHVVGFSDETAHRREDLVAAAADFLAGLPSVTEVLHEDREVVLVTAPDLSTSELSELFAAWWRVAVKVKPPWARAMDDLAAQVAAVLKPVGYRKKRWAFTRAASVDVRHVVELEHRFGGEGEPAHQVRVCGGLYLPVVERAFGPERTGVIEELYCTLRRSSGIADLDDPAAVAAMVQREFVELSRFEQLAPVLAALAAGEDIGWGRDPEFVRAVALAQTGRPDEARPLFQAYVDRLQPVQRPYALQVISRLGVQAPALGANPLLSREEEAAVAAWERAAPGLAEDLRDRLGRVVPRPRGLLRRSSPVDALDGTLESTRVLLRLLDSHSVALLASLEGETPSTALRFFGVHHRGQVLSGRAPLRAAEQCLAERLAAYLGEAVRREVPGARWGIAQDGGICVTARGSAAVLDRALQHLRTVTAEQAHRPLDDRAALHMAAAVRGDGLHAPGLVPG